MAYGTANVDVVQSSTAGTPPQFNDGNGIQTGTLCRAWVQWNGASGASPAIRASFNVSSVTRNGTGDYTVTFSTAFPDANYSSVGSSSPDTAPAQAAMVMDFAASSNTVVAPTTTAIRVSTTALGAAKDATYASLSIFR